jgi:membrane-associated phospholipid phosphatase
VAVTLTPATRPVAVHFALWVLSGLLLASVCVAFLDRPIATWSHAVLHRPPFAVGITKLAGFWVCADLAAVAIAGAVIMRLLYGRLSPAWRTAAAAASATILAALAITLLKYACGRLWPETWTHNNPSWITNHQYGFLPFHGGEGYGSFPSGHTARVTAPFAVLWQRLPKWRPVWALPPLVIAAALIASNFHFLGDCVAGAYAGVAAAALALVVLG